MNKEMPSYQQFLKDEELRATLSKGKTKKRAPGHLYSTLTGGDVYFSTFYCWYEPVYEKAYNRYYDTFTGFRKLATPKVYYWQPAYNKEFTKKSEYLSKYLYLDDKIPARTDCGLVAEIDITDEDVLRNYEERTFVDDASTTAVTYTTVGLSTSKESYILPDHIRQWIISRGYKVLDEQRKAKLWKKPVRIVLNNIRPHAESIVSVEIFLKYFLDTVRVVTDGFVGL